MCKLPKTRKTQLVINFDCIPDEYGKTPKTLQKLPRRIKKINILWIKASAKVKAMPPQIGGPVCILACEETIIHQTNSDNPNDEDARELIKHIVQV